MIQMVGCSHPSCELRGDTWYCTSCGSNLGKAAALFPAPYGPCDHPAVRFVNGRPYCTECGQLRG